MGYRTGGADLPRGAIFRSSRRVLLICGAIYLLACLGCASFQRRLIYYPSVFTTAEAERLAATQHLERWKSPSGKLLGWKRLSPTQPAKGQVVISHGNGGCAFQRAHYADVIQQAAAFDVLFAEYPGYADHPGAPSQTSITQAASEALELLPTNAPIYVLGESLGTGVAAYLAGRHPEKVAGVVLMAPYNCLGDVAQAHFPILPVRWMLCDRYPSEEFLRDYHGPLAILVGGHDRVVPERFGRKLYDGYSGPKRLWEFPQCDHESVMCQPLEVWNEIIAFWQTPRADSHALN